MAAPRVCTRLSPLDVSPDLGHTGGGPTPNELEDLEVTGVDIFTSSYFIRTSPKIRKDSQIPVTTGVDRIR